MKQSVIVTGGAGYIGSHACKALSQAGYTPVVYDNLSIGNRWAVRWGPLEIGDVGDLARLVEVFRKYRPVGVMHFAALALVGESMHEPGLYYRQNVGSAQTIMDAARSVDIGAFVFSSTCAVYGTPSVVPVSEQTPRDPINPYGASKAMVERVLQDYDMAYGFPYAALRYFNAAGADPEGEIGEFRRQETHLVPLAIEALLGRRGSLRILGRDYPTPDGTAIRDYIHVSDLAAVHVLALERLLNGASSIVCNLGTGKGLSVQEAISHIEAISGTSVLTEEAPRRPGDPAELIADTKASEVLFGEKVTARSAPETIIATALAWHKSNRYSAALSA